MELLKSIIGILAYASLGFSATAAYLKINKIWKRKHNTEVANSVSIAGNVVDLIPLSFFTLNYLFVMQWQGLIDSVIWIVAGIVSIMIGSGLWVPANRDKTSWTRWKEALKLEKSEVGDLAKSFFRPAHAEIILEIFAHFAYVDRDLGEREQELIQAFADTWRLDISWKKYHRLANLEGPASLVKARDTVVRYLTTSPPPEQVAQLIDVLQALVQVDDLVASEEKMIMDEAQGLLLNYIDDSDTQASFTVVIAPQDSEQDIAVTTLLPNVKKTEVAGGSGYIVGSYYSQDYANVICGQYRALGFFTVDLVEESPALA